MCMCAHIYNINNSYIIMYKIEILQIIEIQVIIHALYVI